MSVCAGDDDFTGRDASLGFDPGRHLLDVCTLKHTEQIQTDQQDSVSFIGKVEEIGFQIVPDAFSEATVQLS